MKTDGKAAKAKAAKKSKRPKTKAQKKRDNIRNGIIGASVLALVIFVWSQQPVRGGVSVGVCRTYAELQLAYPDTMQLVSMEELERATRLFYTFTDPFGGQRSSRIECKFTTDPKSGNTVLESVTIDRLAQPGPRVAAFNNTIGIVAANKPDATLPFNPGDSLESLKQR